MPLVIRMKPGDRLLLEAPTDGQVKVEISGGRAEIVRTDKSGKVTFQSEPKENP